MLVEHNLEDYNTPNSKNHVCFIYNVMGGNTHVNTMVMKQRVVESQHHMSVNYT